MTEISSPNPGRKHARGRRAAILLWANVAWIVALQIFVHLILGHLIEWHWWPVASAGYGYVSGAVVGATLAVAVWQVASPVPIAVKTAASVTCVVLLIALYSMTTQLLWDFAMTFLISPLDFAVAAGVTLLVSLPLILVIVDDLPGTMGVNNPPRPHQFSIRQIIFLTAYVGGTLAVLRMFVSHRLGLPPLFSPPHSLTESIYVSARAHLAWIPIAVWSVSPLLWIVVRGTAPSRWRWLTLATILFVSLLAAFPVWAILRLYLDGYAPRPLVGSWLNGLLPLLVGFVLTCIPNLLALRFSGSLGSRAIAVTET
jgi:hypothetical protein